MRGDREVRAATFSAQLRRAQAILDRNGVRGRRAAPPLHRLCWLVGIPVPPPLFCSFALDFTLLFVWMATLMCGAAVVVELVAPQGATSLIIKVGVFWLAGLVGAALQARHDRDTARKLGLPRWEDLARPPEPEPGTPPAERVYP